MKTHYLFPNRFKTYGWIIFLSGFVLAGLMVSLDLEPESLDLNIFTIAAQPNFMGDPEYFSMQENNMLAEIVGILLICGLLFIAFAKEKAEDEFIARLRLESLVWATYVNYIILAISILFIYDMVFFWVLIINMFTILLFFLLRFNWILYKTNKQMEHEE